MRLRFLSFLMLPLLGLAQTNSKMEKPIGELLSNEISPNEMKRNASFNLEEIKVRWKKAALENCTGVPCTSFTCGTTTISDLDGNSYNTVLIGTQCWTKQNLKVTKYNDGSAIPLDASGGTNGNAGGETWTTQIAGAYTIYENELSTGPKATNYGFLYNGYAATDARKICPSGWHVPTDGEWTKLIQFIDPFASASAFFPQSTTAGGKMKSTNTTLFQFPFYAGTDNFGFNALPGGRRNPSFVSEGVDVFFWSSTTDPGASNYLNLRLLPPNIVVDRFYDPKVNGNSVRCLKD